MTRTKKFCYTTITEQKCSEKYKEVQKLRINKTKFELAKARSCKTTADIEAAGVPKSTIFAALKRKNLRPETVGKIARALCCDVTEIIDMD